MTEDTSTKSSEEPTVVAGTTRQRKKRKWDEPAELLSSHSIAITGAFPVGFCGTTGICTPGGILLPNAISVNTLSSIAQSSVTTLIQKPSQPKPQDELIAREILINDAEPSTRYKLTKRQTQEEIQKCTGAVVITRGKYRPPNALPDSEKPLYLHISAGSHLKDMAERIIAVDRAASMVEEIIRQGQNSLSFSGPYTTFNSNGQTSQPLSICLFLGFEPEPSKNIAARIRGPNDQYINHIINETGATVVLRGQGSGNHHFSQAEEAQQPLHLYLSSTNSKSLEAARILAENLLDTISAECCASRVSSCKVYNAVPPPQQLTGSQNCTIVEMTSNPTVSSPPTICGITQTAQSFTSDAAVVSPVSNVPPPVLSIQKGFLTGCAFSSPSMDSYVYPTSNGGTYYSGYGGIYPQATPLQQVALALKQAPISTTSIVASTTVNTSALPMVASPIVDTDKRQQLQKRKFQELPAASKGSTTLSQNSRQGSECFKSGLEEAVARNFSSMPQPKKLNQEGSNELRPPPPVIPPPPKFVPRPPPLDVDAQESVRVMMPPPPPKFSSSQILPEAQNKKPVINKVSETPNHCVKSLARESWYRTSIC
ncbi:hypothetical protein HPP92_007698 [Vanilla planifolia]|uniref:Protein RIK n=1 Tax=Vanilla planifolia TaxID=51239 RepID=A0A835REJ5_VANPL|nr:hypothetical protein HPP92_007698 [Vanilla planifolia]